MSHASDERARAAGRAAGHRGGDASENPYRRGGSPDDRLLNQRHARLWERARAGAYREYLDRRRLRERVMNPHPDPWRAHAEYVAAGERIKELVGKMGGGGMSDEDAAEVQRLHAVRAELPGEMVSSYIQDDEGRLVQTTPSRVRQKLELVRARSILNPPEGMTGEEVAAFYDRHYDELLDEAHKADAEAIRWRPNGAWWQKRDGDKMWSLGRSRSTKQWVLYRSNHDGKGIDRDHTAPSSRRREDDSRRWSAARAQRWADAVIAGEPEPSRELRPRRVTGADAELGEAEDYLGRIGSLVLKDRASDRREAIAHNREIRQRHRRLWLKGADRAVLISCSAKKAEGGYRTPDELYTGPLFRAALRYAQERGLPWFVLSARHGLVTPDKELRPYDQKLKPAEAHAWGERVVKQMDDLGLLTAGSGVPSPVWEIHAGALYAESLSSLLRARDRVLRGKLYRFRAPERVEPLTGLQVGQRLAWYAERRGE